MKRRHFLRTTLITSVLPLSSPLFTSLAQGQESRARQFYELREYYLREGREQVVYDYLRNAAIPAYNRLGIEPVGVFIRQEGTEEPSLYLLIPHPNIDSFATSQDRLMEDETLRRDGANYFDALQEPPYDHVVTTLARAFSGKPVLEVPEQHNENNPYILELRIYQSPTEKAAKKKVEMFNEGEIEIFRKVGWDVVFFGETLSGPRMPNLTYMAVYDDQEQRNSIMQTFGSHPDWKQMSSDPQYQDIVSNITSIILESAPYSQI